MSLPESGPKQSSSRDISVELTPRLHEIASLFSADVQIFDIVPSNIPVFKSETSLKNFAEETGYKPPKEYLELLEKLSPRERSVITAALNAARRAGFETLGSTRDTSPEKMVMASRDKTHGASQLQIWQAEFITEAFAISEDGSSPETPPQA